MNVLLIANADSHWTLKLVREVLDYDKNKISVLSLENNQNRQFYEENEVKVIVARDGKNVLDRIKGVRTLRYLAFLRKTCSKSNSEILIYVYPAFWELFALSGLSCLNKMVYMYIGSDLNACPYILLRLPLKIICRSKNVIVMTSEQKNIFMSVYGQAFKGKITEMHFGKDCFNSIDAYRNCVQSCKNIFLDMNNKDRFIVTVGYNSSKSQQVDKVLKQLLFLDKDLKQRIFLIIPMQYGSRDIRYEKRVNNYLNELNIPYIILTEYFDMNKVAELVIASDVFINSQTDDAISSAVVEQLYSGTVMISGRWLESQYKLLKDLGIFYKVFENFDSLVETMTDVIGQIENYKVLSEQNYKKMADEWNWKKCFDQMSSIYDYYRKETNYEQ